jgi:hypothetical protein
MTCVELKEVLDLYIDGELEPERRPGFEAHAGRCGACGRQVERRRALAGALRGALDASLEGAEPRGGERERVVESMAKAARRRLVFPARLAAAAVIGVTVGLVAYAMGLSRATPEEMEVAESMRDKEARGAQIKQLRAEAAADLTFVRGAVEPEKRQDPAGLAVNVAASTIARRLERDMAPPPDPSAAKERRLVVKSTVNGAAVEIVQMGDGRVTLIVPGRTIEAPSMADLQKRHGDLCRKFSVQGREGAVRVGESVASTDLKGQLHLLWRTGSWDEDVQWEAARTWMAGRVPDAAEMEKRIREMRDRCKAASAPAAAPEVKIDLAALLAEVKGRSRRELEETRVRLEREMKRLEAELEELRELRGRAKGLRAFAEAVTGNP